MAKFAYVTKYGSPEADACKKAGAKWNRVWKVWESTVQVEGVPEAAPDHRKVYEAWRGDRRAELTVKAIENLKLKLKKEGYPPQEVVEKILEKLTDDDYGAACCRAALELYLALITAGAKTDGFWAAPVEVLEARIEEALQGM